MYPTPHIVGRSLIVILEVANLCQQELRPSALVLEAPFNNIFDEVELEKIQMKRSICLCLGAEPPNGLALEEDALL